MFSEKKTKQTRRLRRLLAVTLLVAAVLTPVLSLAQTLVVDGGTTLPVPPDISNDYVIVGDLSGGTINQTGGTNTVNNDLTLGNTATASGNYNLSGSGSLSAGSEYVGYSGTGTFTQTGGTNTVGGLLWLNYSSGGSGTYNLSGTGSLSVASDEYVAFFGSGTFNQSGGTHTVGGSLNLGSFLGSGTYNLSDTGSLSVTFNELIHGSFNQSGGTHTTSVLYLGNDGSGTYNLSGTGSLSVGWDENIGTTHSGEFIQTGGTHTAASYLTIGYGGTGTYTLSGTGILSVGMVETIGYGASGIFNQSGGTHTVTGDLSVGYADSGTYNLSGTGILSAANEYIGGYPGSPWPGTGTFTQNGGTHTVTGDLYLGFDSSGSGTYNQSGGSLLVGYEYIGYEGSGTFTQTSGAHQCGELYVGHTASGTYNLDGGSLASWTQSIGYDGSGAFTQNGGTNTAYAIGLGENAGASGTYTLNNGRLEAYYDEYIGFKGSGSFTQNGGTNTVTGDEFLPGTLTLGYDSTASGTYTLNGGSLSAEYEIIGDCGTGVFNQTGGTHTVSDGCGTGGLAMGCGGTGTYNLSGGTLTTDGEYLGFCGAGIFNQSGGSHTTVEIYLADSGGSAIYNLQGGSFTVGTVYLNPGGTFNQTGGSLNAATFNQLGGEVQGSLENRGTFIYDSGLFSGRLLNYGTVNLLNDFTAGNGLANYASFNIDPGRTVTLNGLGLDNQGSLAVNGLLIGGGPLLNNTGGVLSGSGIIQGNLTNSGTVCPGNSPGAMTILGDYTQTPGGALTVEMASATSYDQLNVTGTAFLNGALRPVLLGGYRPSAGQTFSSVLTAAGGVNGTFSTVGNFTFTLVGRAIYTGNSVDLLVARDYTNPALNLTPNQRAVGNMLNGLAGNASGDLNQVLNTIDWLGSSSEVADAYQQISADKAASLANLGFAGANLFKLGLANRITNLRFGGLGGGGGLGGLGSFNLNYSRASGLMLAYNSSSLAGLITAKKKAAPATRWGLYLDPGLVLGSQKTTINQTGYNFTIAGFTAGADYRLKDDLLIGLATGYSHTGADFRGSGGSVENHTWPLTAYAAYLPESFYAYGSLGYALNLFNLERQLSIGDLSRQAASSPTGHQFNAYGEAGYDVKTSSLVLTPLVSLAYSSLWVSAFTENGAGSLNLEVASQQADSLQTGVGAKIAAPLKRNGVTVVPQVYATYQHEFTNNTRGLNARLSQGSSTFIFQTEQLGQDFAVLGANATILTQKNFSLQLNYNAEVGRAHYTAHNLNAGVRWEF